MKQITFEVTLTFSEEINDDLEIKEVAQNILEGLVYTVDTSGLVPEDNDGWTKHIKVIEPLSETCLEHDCANF